MKTLQQLRRAFPSLLCFTLVLKAAADPPASNVSHFANLGTHRVHYLVDGEGPTTVVFVHCWAGNSGFWREQIPALIPRKARLIRVDLPGHGRSDQPAAATNYTAAAFARAVIAVLQDTRTEKAILVGHSMGVPVICQVHRQAPDRVAALVAVDGMLRKPTFKPEEAAEFVAPFGRPDYRDHVKRFIGSMFPAGNESLRDRVLEEMLATPQFVMLGAMEGMFGPAQPAWDLDKPTVPVIAINARNPMWTAEYEAYVRALSPRTDYRTLEGVGHFLMLEKPAEFNRALLESLAKFGLLLP